MTLDQTQLKKLEKKKLIELIEAQNDTLENVFDLCYKILSDCKTSNLIWLFFTLSYLMLGILIGIMWGAV